MNHGLFAGTDLSLNSFAPGEILLFQRGDERNVEQRAFFGELSYDLSDQIKLTVGGRAFKYDRVDEAQFFDAAFSVESTVPSEGDESDHSLKAGIEYTPDESTLLYATWSEGFRLGYSVPANPLPACDTNNDGVYDGSNGVSTGARLIDSDTVENFEFGAKFSLLNDRLQANTAVYQVDWDGIPITQTFDFCSAPSNAGEARSRGAELELTYQIHDSMLVNFNSSYIDAELTEDAVALGAQAGDRLPGSPRYNLSLGLEYGFDLNGHDAYLRSDYAHVGGFYNNLQESGTEIGDYGKLNIKAGITVDQFDIDIYINNLTNEDSITWIDTEGFPNRGNRLRPRMIGLNVGYRF